MAAITTAIRWCRMARLPPPPTRRRSACANARLRWDPATAQRKAQVCLSSLAKRPAQGRLRCRSVARSVLERPRLHFFRLETVARLGEAREGGSDRQRPRDPYRLKGAAHVNTALGLDIDDLIGWRWRHVNARAHERNQREFLDPRRVEIERDHVAADLHTFPVEARHHGRRAAARLGGSRHPTPFRQRLRRGQAMLWTREPAGITRSATEKGLGWLGWRGWHELVPLEAHDRLAGPRRREAKKRACGVQHAKEDCHKKCRAH